MSKIWISVLTRIKLIKREHIILLILCLASLLLKTRQLGEKPFTFDESIYVTISKYFSEHGFSWQYEREVGSAMPPLQFFIMGYVWKGFSWLGNEEFIFRLPSVIMSIIAIFFFYGLSQKVIGGVGALLATILFGTHPLIVVYSRFAALDLPAVMWALMGAYFYFKPHFFKPLQVTSKIKIDMDLVFSGFFLGLATLTKPYYGAWLIIVLIDKLILIFFKTISPKIAFRDFVFVTVSLVATVFLISFLFSGTPTLPYLIFQTITTFPGWGQVHNPFVSFVNHFGLGVLLIGSAGLFIPKYRIRSFTFLLGLSSALSFSPTGRYLLVIMPLLCVGFGIFVNTFYKAVKNNNIFFKVFMVMFLIFSSVASCYSPMLKLYSADVVDGWMYSQEYVKISQKLKDKSAIVLTNGHWAVLRYYSNLSVVFYMGLENNTPKYYTIYDPINGKPNVLDMNPNIERNLKYIVLDYHKFESEDILFENQMDFGFANIDNFLVYYLNSFYELIYEGRNIVAYKRISENVFTLENSPKLWVGEGGIEQSYFLNNNGWIFGGGWSKPLRIDVNNRTFMVRKAGRNDSAFADFIMTSEYPKQLVIEYWDLGYGEVSVYAKSSSGNFTVLSKLILNDSGEIRKVEIPYSGEDICSDVRGKQHHFTLDSDTAIYVISLTLVSLGSDEIDGS